MTGKVDSRPTMDDVAIEAGVSQMTVSRVMRGTGQTSEQVRHRVEQAARKLGYVPNRLATSLRDALSCEEQWGCVLELLVSSGSVQVDAQAVLVGGQRRLHLDLGKHGERVNTTLFDAL